MSTFVLSAFADEVATDLQIQLQVLRELDIHYLDLRSVDGVNVRDLTDRDVIRIRETLHRNAVRVACIASLVGKSAIDGPLDDVLSALDRVIEIGHALGTRNIRLFSFYPPQICTTADRYVDQAITRLERLIGLARRKDALLLLENEQGLVGDSLSRCYRLMRSLVGDHFRFLWNPANFVRVGEPQVTDHGWDLVGEYTAHVDIKDALLSDGSVVAAGEGDGQVKALLAHLQQSGYNGFLSLEPHLAQAGRDSGFTGPEKMAEAVRALRQILADLGVEEAQQLSDPTLSPKLA
ncbi:sugar phosphate isomerase/epimerase [bacterium]|nr:sugar phosphate isomerase/epimerase [bacterium]